MEYTHIIVILFFRQFERVPDVLNRAYMGDMEHVDLYRVYMGQKGSFVFMLPSSYEGSLQIEINKNQKRWKNI